MPRPSWLNQFTWREWVGVCFLSSVATLGILVATLGRAQAAPAAVQQRATPLYSYQARVVRVIDGDTIVVNIDLGFRISKNEEHLRLEGIDTPEVRGDEREAGLKSKAFVEEWVRKNGHVIYLRTTQQGKYGRWLAYLWESPEMIGDRSKSLNQLLLSEGLATEYK